MTTSQPSPNNNFPIIGVGASAGSLEPLQSFLSHLSEDSGMAYVVLVHLASEQASSLSDILQRSSPLPVHWATNDEPLRPNQVYVIPPKSRVEITPTSLKVNSILREQVSSSIDSFFHSLGENHRDRAVAIILSGMGSDGTLGIRTIKAHEGLVLAQSPDTASYSEMPKSAIASNLVDVVLSPEAMPETLINYFQQRSRSPEITPEQWLEEIFTLLRSETRHDFSLYKINTLNRRIKHRMSLQQIDSYEQYVSLLRQNSQEINTLFQEFLIGVTSFFRNPEAFATLKNEVIPPLLTTFPEQQPFRVWVPGCSTGEEVYSLAMILQEAIERTGKSIDLQIFGTDIDPRAIDRAREGIFPASAVKNISQERLYRFFEIEGQYYRIGNKIRHSVVFSLQNILKDPPFSRLNLVSCRNLLIYLNESAQKQIIPLLHYTLLPSGILMLGSSETIGKFQNLFHPLNNKWKIFQRRELGSPQRQPLQFPSGFFEKNSLSSVPPPTPPNRGNNFEKLVQQTLLQEFVPTAVLINSSGIILYVEGRTGDFLEMVSGSPNNNIIELAREGLKVELGAAFQEAIISKETVTRKRISVRKNGDTQPINFSIKPLQSPKELAGYFLVVFERLESQVTNSQSEEEVSQLNFSADEKDNRIAELEQQLKKIGENHQATIEELQATNEELKSSNEELQATNEELESSKEELQSLNEELHTVNEELQRKVDELSAAENDMQNLLNSTEIATIFVNNQMRIKRYTPEVTELVKLIPSDIGRPLPDISTAFNQDIMINNLEQVLTSLTLQVTKLQTKAGEWYQMRILPYRTTNNNIEGAILTFTNIDKLQKTQDRLEAIRLAMQEIIEVSSEPLILLNQEQKIIAVSQNCEQLIPNFFNRELSEWEQKISEQLGTLLNTEEALTDVVLEIKLEPEKRDRVAVDRIIIGTNTNLKYSLLKLKSLS